MPGDRVDTSLGGLRLRRVLDRIASERGLPEAIVLDNGPGMRNASTGMPEQGTQTPFPAPDLIPAEPEKSTQDLHSDGYSKWGHFTVTGRGRVARA